MSDYTSCRGCMIIWEDTPDRRKCQRCGADLHCVGDVVKARSLQQKYRDYKFVNWVTGLSGQEPGLHSNKGAAGSQAPSTPDLLAGLDEVPVSVKEEMMRSWPQSAAQGKKEDVASSIGGGSAGQASLSRPSSIAEVDSSAVPFIPTGPRAMAPPPQLSVGSGPVRHGPRGYGNRFSPLSQQNHGFGGRGRGGFGSGVVGNVNNIPIGASRGHGIENESGSGEKGDVKSRTGLCEDQRIISRRPQSLQQHQRERSLNYGDQKSSRAPRTDTKTARRSRSDGFIADAYGPPAPVKREFKFCSMHFDTTHWMNDPDCLAAQNKAVTGEEAIRIRKSGFATRTSCEKVLEREEKSSEGSKALLQNWGKRAPKTYYDVALHVALQMRWLQKYFEYCECREQFFMAIYDGVLDVVEAEGGQGNGPVVLQGLLAQAQTFCQEVVVDHKALITELYEKVFIKGLKRDAAGLQSDDDLVDGWLADSPNEPLREEDRKAMDEIWGRIRALSGRCTENNNAVIVRARSMAGAFSGYKFVQAALVIIQFGMIKAAPPDHERFFHALHYPNFAECRQILVSLLHNHGDPRQ